MGKIISIDNGGTLTDICVMDNGKVYHTKTVTTPYDLSQCFIDGLKKVSETIYGSAQLDKLLNETDNIFYSTTEGTNALVQRRGPRIGLIVDQAAFDEIESQIESELFQALVAGRIKCLDFEQSEEALEISLVRTVNDLSSAGANRLVVCTSGDDSAQVEQLAKRILLRKYPRQLLGAVPLLFGHELTSDRQVKRRIWTAVFNAFLHPSIEKFLYSAEGILREYRVKNPLLIYKNDGCAARVAKTIALKTYSSGPCGGMAATQLIASRYKINDLITMDVGGTTTDLGRVINGKVVSDYRGKVEQQEISYPMNHIISVGVGGGSIIRAEEGEIKVGPQSVGGAPGPACFGFGGTDATITDVLLMQGVLEPTSYFGGKMALDVERSANAVEKNVSQALSLSKEQALDNMVSAWQDKAANSISDMGDISADSVLCAFGGAGPMCACAVAEKANINTIIIPGLAAVLSAYGVNYSQVGHSYESDLDSCSQAALDEAMQQLLQKAQRDLYAEGHALDGCDITIRLVADEVLVFESTDGQYQLNDQQTSNQPASLFLQVSKTVSQRNGEIDNEIKNTSATATAKRTISYGFSEPTQVDVFELKLLSALDSGNGPAILEDDFFTCVVDAGWQFEITTDEDIMLTRNVS